MTPEPTANVSSNKDVGKFVDLPGAEEGKVVTRFPPEASGYLHIGHAKAALLNDYYAKFFKGTLLMRFDDTNPSKEKEDFEHVILEDMQLLGIKYDKLSYTSDHFETLLGMCEKMLRDGLAYVDDTEPDKMKEEREAKIKSANRSNTPEKNLSMWNDMKQATSFGTKCAVRAKIDMDSANGCMRDPTIYRCKAETHPRTKNKYNVYPTYDFACPIVDSVEGVTHALRTTEYYDRDAQYYWFIDQLQLRKPFIYSYGRLAMMNTLLSKRKLTWFVEQGIVEGWDDPRFPTVRGILRHGLTVEGLRSFIVAQGSSRNVIQMEWDKIWAFNKKVIDPVAPRYTTVVRDAHVTVHVEGGARLETKQVVLHPKNDAVGTKSVCYGPNIIIDMVDAESIREGEIVTFINWGNMLIKTIERDGKTIKSITAVLQLDNTDYKKTTKLTWLAAASAATAAGDSAAAKEAAYTPCVVVYHDHIISKAVIGKDEEFHNFVNYSTKFETCMLGEHAMRNIKRGEIVQLQRRGFFICDQSYAEIDPLTSRAHRPCILFYVPDGHSSRPLKELLPSYGSLERNAPTPSAKLPPAAQLSSSTEPAAAAVTAVPSTSKAAASSAAVVEILHSIKSQGEHVRQLKENKADKAAVKTEVDKLLKLKTDFKQVSGGKEWSAELAASMLGAAADDSKSTVCTTNAPSTTTTTTALSSSSGVAGFSSSAVVDVLQSIKSQGELVRQLKENKADKPAVKAEVDKLLKLKTDFKQVSGGKEWSAELATSMLVGGNNKSSSATTAAPVVPPSATTVTVTTTTTTSTTSTSTAPAAAAVVGLDILRSVKAQGETIRRMKETKADKTAIKTEVDKLVALKKEYQTLSGKEWTVELNALV